MAGPRECPAPPVNSRNSSPATAFSLWFQWPKESAMASSATTLPRHPAAPPIPAEIARNGVLTTREKLDLLYRLRGEITGERANPAALPFDIGAIDRAIEEVRRDARDGTERALRTEG
jgi:hypothetical protein